MIKNDFRYIIKKIIIGLGIFVGIFYFKSCNVHALNDQWYDFNISQNNLDPVCLENNSTYTYVINGNTYNISLNNNGIYINGTYISSLDERCRGFTIGTDLNDNVIFYMNILQSSFNTFNESNFGSIPDINSYPFLIKYLSNSPSGAIKIIFDNNGSFVSKSNISPVSANIHGYAISSAIMVNEDYYVYGTNLLRMIYASSNPSVNRVYIYSDFDEPIIIPPTESKIVSLNPQPILSDDNSVLLGYNFTLEFDNFSTDNFVYKYKIGNSRTLIFTTNNYQLSLRNNDTLYVWSEDLEGNVIDSETFTVTNIGDLYKGEYSIDFTYKDIAPSDTQNSTGLSNIIDRVDIDITYLPKTNRLKYQYQYVDSGGSLDPQNWIQLNNDNSLNNYTYVAHSNGTLYARILDENDNVVSNNTFTVDSIGKIKLYKDNNNIGGFFDDIKKNINYTGPIYSLILMPVNFLQILYNSASSGTCNRYKIGTLFNNDIYFECIDFTDYIGYDLYNLIDILSSSGVIFGIALFIKRKYNEFMNLNDNSKDIM